MPVLDVVPPRTTSAAAGAAGGHHGPARCRRRSRAVAPVLAQIETAEGAAAAEAIAATPGIDGVFVGPSELAAFMERPGQQTHHDVIAAVHQPSSPARLRQRPRTRPSGCERRHHLGARHPVKATSSRLSSSVGFTTEPLTFFCMR
ncbi:aldolase/citrate lyase family protein [Microbispora bryophytorum]|uniref:aldolase/citrate lyase family protein n=1 Tax=Microbispora bryophytorum TaxID=1460882 RepID=UPI00371C5443